MQTPLELVDEVVDLATLFGVLLAGGDADTVIDGMHRVVTQLRENAQQLQEAMK
jgi:hypothetical protein